MDVLISTSNKIINAEEFRNPDCSYTAVQWDKTNIILLYVDYASKSIPIKIWESGKPHKTKCDAKNGIKNQRNNSPTRSLENFAQILEYKEINAGKSI